MYLDSCILVKLLVVEPDSEFFIGSLEGKPLVTSELAQTEVFSALLARERAGKISTADRRRAWREFEARIAEKEIRIEKMNSVVLHKAAHLLERCHPKVPLRTLDAIHLATADLCHDFPLVTTDGRLRDAAQLMGFSIFPET
jgi:predicted nucleic acid-binding protein